MAVIQKLIALVIDGVGLAIIAYVLFRLFRPKTTREILGRPTSFFQRLQPTVDAYGDADSSESRKELLREAVEAFERGLTEHRLGTPEYRLELTIDELGLASARVHRNSDDRAWSLQEFDDDLLASPLPKSQSRSAG